MKHILLTLAVFTLAITALHAQVPAPDPAPAAGISGIDPADAAAISSLLPPSLAAYGSLILVVGMILGRAYKAIKANGGIVGIYNAIVHGADVPLILGALCLLILPSCTQWSQFTAALSTPKAKQIEVGLADIGLIGAVAGGVLSPGDAVSIAKGVAVITSSDTSESKIVNLSKLGLDTAVAKGVIKPGDVVQITQSSAIITPAPIPPSNEAAPAVAPTADIGSGK